MVFRVLGLSLIFFTFSAYAQGRKPAVEDFVGIEVDQTEVLPQGTEPLFNLEQDITRLQEVRPEEPTEISPSHPPKEWSFMSLLSITMTLGLPLVLWFMIMAHMRKKASLESASNIEVLEKFRKNREMGKRSEEAEEIKKVS